VLVFSRVHVLFRRAHALVFQAHVLAFGALVLSLSLLFLALSPIRAPALFVHLGPLGPSVVTTHESSQFSYAVRHPLFHIYNMSLLILFLHTPVTISVRNVTEPGRFVFLDLGVV